MEHSIKHSEEFIRKITNNKNGFSIPENYFFTVENDIYTKRFVSSLSKQTSFKIPKDYFLTLEDSILSKVLSKEKEVNVISLHKRILRLVPIVAAASLLLFIGLNYFSSTTVTFKDISVADLDKWYENNIETVTTSELAMVLETSDFNEDDFLETTLEEATLEEYLNSIDNATLLNEIQ